VIRSGGQQALAPERSAAAPVVPPAAASPPTDFEQFVQDSLGHSLPVFGRGLFQNTGTGFAPPTGVAPPSDYVLGPGDQVIIRTWGKIDIDATSTVDRNGQIFVPRIGTLTVAGMRVDQLTDFIRRSISQQFMGFDLTVTLGQLRSIQIFVLGQARAPGVYTISSLSTLVNTLFASGGPSSIGSLRDVQLKRAGQVVTHFDVYRFLLAGDKSSDVHLLPGDIIYIPVSGPQVAVDGSVGTPGIFELKDEENIAGLLKDAGGLTPVAGTARVVLEHIVGHSRRSIEEFALDSKGMGISLQGGDIVRVFPISPKIDDAVTLRGTIASPGRYAWHPGMRISDLIPNREFLLTRAYYNRQNALDLPNGSHPFGIEAPATDAAPAVEGHDTEINFNYAVIERLDASDLTTHLVPFALGEAIAQPTSAENKELQPGDVVVIYSRKDVNLPMELEARFVRIDGQVQAPGVYRLEENETLRDLVRRAGGLAPHSYLYAAQLTRESVRLSQEAELRELVARESREALSPSNSPSGPAGGAGGSASTDLDLRKAYIAELAKIHASGRVVLQVKPEANSAADLPDFILEDGDHFFVPSLSNTVSVLGNVYNQGALRYLEASHTQQYLDAAGGETRDGDPKREFILRADGTIVSRQRVSGLAKLPIHPGDTVVVPPRLKSGSHVYDLLNFTQIFSAFAVTALAIEALK
jgi:protein involved in polysaccharide export with SLBB domain